METVLNSIATGTDTETAYGYREEFVTHMACCNAADLGCICRLICMCWTELSFVAQSMSRMINLESYTLDIVKLTLSLPKSWNCKV